MKKKIILYITCAVLILSIGLGGALIYFEKPIIKDATLYVNGINITDKNVTIRKEKFSKPVIPFPDIFIAKIEDLFSKEYYCYADLPLTEVMKSLGMNVEWIDVNSANVTYEDKKYILDLEKVSIVEEGTSFNFVLPPPGGHLVYTVIDRELLLDDLTVNDVLYYMGIKIKIKIDNDKSIIYITQIED